MQTALRFRDIHPDATRIAAISAAIALNGLLALFLIGPMSAPRIIELRDDVIDVILIRPQPEKEKKKEEPIKVEVKREVKPREQRVEPRPATATPPVVEAQPGDEPAEVVRETPFPPLPPVPPSDPVDEGRPLEGATLQYAVAPPPAFPREAIRDQLEGTVMLEVLVDVDGTPLDVKVSRSSGHRVLDAAARKQVLTRWKFRPAMRNGRAVQAIGLVPVEFRLDG